MSEYAANTGHAGLDAVRKGINEACREAGRDPSGVTLIVVSKTFDAPAISPVIAAGQRIFGENRVQEAQRKWPDLKAQTPSLELHLIGPLQSNKAKDAVALFDAIHSVDRLKIAQAIAESQQKTGRTLQLFIQVNTGLEPQKAGVAPADLSSFLEQCRESLELDVAGLMCIPPVAEDPVVHFQLLAELAKREGLRKLSMGMSSDYRPAIQHGATHIRVGSAIFGKR